MSEAVYWLDDHLTPRVDVLAAEFTADSDTLPVAHPEWFRPGDIVRVGDDDLYDTGEVDLWGQPILRARNEAVKVIAVAEMLVKRAVGANPSQSKSAGERVFILASEPL